MTKNRNQMGFLVNCLKGSQVAPSCWPGLFVLAHFKRGIMARRVITFPKDDFLTQLLGQKTVAHFPAITGGDGVQRNAHPSDWRCSVPIYILLAMTANSLD